jgi:hypothetical protein
VCLWYVIILVKIMVTPLLAVGVAWLVCVTIISGALSRLYFIIVIFLGADTKSGHAPHVDINTISCNMRLLRALRQYTAARECATTKRATLQVPQTDILASLVYLRSRAADAFVVLIISGRIPRTA